MNETKVQTIINNLIEDARKSNPKAANKQYPMGKAQTQQLTDLGILHLMPARSGFWFADIIIKAANQAAGAGFNAYGEGDSYGSSDLYAALHEVEQVEEVATGSDGADGEEGDNDHRQMLSDLLAVRALTYGGNLAFLKFFTDGDVENGKRLMDAGYDAWIVSDTDAMLQTFGSRALYHETHVIGGANKWLSREKNETYILVAPESL